MNFSFTYFGISGSKHAPWSNEGAIILVKLRQMVDPTEPLLRINYTRTLENSWSQLAPGVRELEVYKAQKDMERVTIVEFSSTDSSQNMCVVGRIFF
jgi:hypothetical protein